MPIGPQGQKRPPDLVGCAVHVCKVLTGEVEESPEKPRQPHKAAGGKAGGEGAARLTPARRREIAHKGAEARWG